MECEMPKFHSNDDEIREYFNKCKTIAVVGCSPKPEKDSHRVSKYLLEAGYNIIPIYPKEEYILGAKVYKSLKDIKEPVDMVVVFRKPQVVDDIADVCIERGDVKVLWTQIGIINNSASAKALENNISVVQNMCAMVEHKKLFGTSEG
ncbi:CoA-binding domain protein [hydrothermal vent metagenome]|uniref:CoA-binding domain protein n=1 Tax=hydrothermal vent metagenome TaxID=652676 RepID=A0A1W1EI95_9ZZZZ